ncbi:hypothetical protein BD560DRAFT_491562 [Blakeslea trispora]|nr:hypothetical protein BD560DRAFT_491562 [Blakeslea trispora]
MAGVDKNRNGREDDIFQPTLPLVEEYIRDYVYHLSEDDVVNDTIERMYGPFDSWHFDNGSSVLARKKIIPAKSVHDKKLEEIEKLKRDIREKEEQQRQAQEKRLALERESALDKKRVLQEVRQQEQEEQEKQQKDLKAQSEEEVQNTIDPSVMNNGSIARNRSKNSYSNNIKITKNSETRPTSDPFEFPEDKLTINPELLKLPNKTEDDRALDSDSYLTAEEDNDEAGEQRKEVKKEPKEEQKEDQREEQDDEEKLLDQEIAELHNELQKLNEVENQIQVKLLAMKVRMSIEKNRKETAKKNNISKEPTPELRSKRTKQQKTSTRASKKKRYVEETQNFGTLPSQPLPNFGYQLPVYFNPMPLRPQYYLPNTLMMNQPYLQHPAQQPVPPPPPPPPPTDLPPPIPPPPPPPPQVSQQTPSARLRQSHKPTPATPYADIAHNDSHRVKAYEATLGSFREIEQLVSMRIFHSNQELYPSTNPIRMPPKPRRLITVEGYTVPINMFFLDKKSETDQQATQKHQGFILPAGQPIKFELTDLTYESPLFTMLYRKAEGKKFDEKMSSAINAAILCIPSDMDLSTFHVRHAYGLPLHPEKLFAMYQLVKAFCDDYREKEFWGALKLELSMFVNGPLSVIFQRDVEATKNQFPLSVDVHWQSILSETTFVAQLARIKAFLNDVYKSHGAFDSPESVAASAVTAEVLTRLVRLNGLTEVLKMLTGNGGFEISLSSYAPFSLTETPGLYLLHNDKYHLWMLILYYFVMKSLPQGVCEAWMNTLVKEGKPQMSKPLFSIDWTDALLSNPLDKATLFGAVNILLSMWKYFSQLACSDSRKKPLLVGVLRTLVSFLMHTPQYKVPGTLLLVNKLTKVLLITPEIRELEIELEFKRNEDPKKLIHLLFSTALQRPQSLTLAYRCICLYGERAPHTNGFYGYTACILAFPLANAKSDSEALLTFIDHNDMEDTAHEYRHRLVQSLIDQYKGLVGMIPSPSPSAKSQEKAAFAWINLLLLTRILGVVSPEKQPEVRQEMDTIFDTGVSLINEYDGKLLFFKYATTLTADNEE